MDGITIAVEIRAHAVYQMLSEGLTPTEVADNIKGIGLETAELLKQQKDHGVPAHRATTTVRRHQRKLPGAVGFLRIEVGTETLKAWRRIAKAHDKTVADIALPAIEAAFKALT